MVDVDIDIENALVGPEEFEDGQDNVVDVAESGSFAFTGMVETASPVDGNVGFVLGENGGGGWNGGRLVGELEGCCDKREEHTHKENHRKKSRQNQTFHQTQDNPLPH